MERRKAVTIAGAASLTLLAGGAGIAINSGIIGANDDDNVGNLTPVDGSTPSITVYLDTPTSRAVPPAAPSVQPSSGTPVTTSAASATGRADDEGSRDDGDQSHDDDQYDDDGDRHEDDDDTDHDEQDEYEGADDDD